MLFVCRPYCVLATASLFALAVALPASAQDASGDDLYGDAQEVSSEAPAAAAVFPPPRAVETPARPRRSRPVPADPYEATGLRMGAFTLFPTLEIGAAATSNVANASSGARADAGLLLRPGLRVESDWTRHQFTAKASGEMLHYLRESDLSTLSGDLQANLRLDVRKGTTLEFENGYTLTSTGSSDSEVPDTAVGNRLSHLLRSQAALTHETGITDLKFTAGLRREMFDDVKLSGGGVEDNGDRDYTQADFSLRGTFNNGAVLRPFAEVALSPRVHDRKLDRNGLRRDSLGYSGTLGLRIDDDPVWSGEVGVGYMVRDYEDPSLASLRSPGLLANLQWRPTELTRVDLSASMGISETASSTDSGTRSWSTGAKVTHSLRDNLDLVGGTTFSASRNSSGTDKTYGLEAGVEWKINPYLAWAFFYDGSWLDSAGGGDSDEQRLLASIILKR